MIAYVLIVTDGEHIRTIHRPAFSREDAAKLDDIALRAVLPPGPILQVTQPAPAPKKIPPLADRAREMARDHGYTGDSCDNCGSFKMKRSGTCNVCEACGTTTGCS